MSDVVIVPFDVEPVDLGAVPRHQLEQLVAEGVVWYWDRLGIVDELDPGRFADAYCREVAVIALELHRAGLRVSAETIGPEVQARGFDVCELFRHPYGIVASGGSVVDAAVAAWVLLGHLIVTMEARHLILEGLQAVEDRRRGLVLHLQLALDVLQREDVA